MSLLGVYLNEKANDTDKENELLSRIGSTLFLIGWALDLFDGAVARAKNQVNDFGAKLDNTGDRFVDGFPAVVALQTAKGREKAAWLLYEWMRSLPSMLRHEAVAAGQKVPELDFGSRLPRTGQIFLRMIAPEKYKETLIWTADLSALLTSIKRLNILIESGDEKAIQDTYRKLVLYTLSFIAAELSHLPANHLLWELGNVVLTWRSKEKEIKKK